MPVPHLEIRIVQRSKGSSAVAGAAYQAGEKLFSEYDQKMKNYLYKKEVVYTEVMLPTNAPPGYADRATLWNAAEEVEKQWNSQLARRFVVALPREAPTEMYPQMMQEYCREHFVSKGMCCDFAIHDPDPPGHNPHCHTPEQRYRQEESRCYKVLSDYFHHLRTWKQQYAPKQLEDEWHPLFVEALQRESHIEYLLDVLLYGTAEEKKALVAEQRKEVKNLEQRFAEHPDEHDRGGSQRESGLDR